MVVQMWQNYSKNNCILKKKYVCFLQKLNFLSHNFFSNKTIYLQKIYILIPFEKNSLCEKKNSFLKKNFVLQKKKKNHSGKKIFCKNVSFRKKSHSLKNKFYFQFNFATNQQV